MHSRRLRHNDHRFRYEYGKPDLKAAVRWVRPPPESTVFKLAVFVTLTARGRKCMRHSNLLTETLLPPFHREVSTYIMAWIAQLLQLLFARRTKPEELSPQDQYRLDMAVVDEGDFDQEGLVIEAGEVVGETATVNTHSWKLKATEGHLPARSSSPLFDSLTPIVLKRQPSSPTMTLCSRPARSCAISLLNSKRIKTRAMSEPHSSSTNNTSSRRDTVYITLRIPSNASLSFNLACLILTTASLPRANIT